MALNCPENSLINNKCLATQSGLKYAMAKPVLDNTARAPFKALVFFTIQSK